MKRILIVFVAGCAIAATLASCEKESIAVSQEEESVNSNFERRDSIPPRHESPGGGGPSGGD